MTVYDFKQYDLRYYATGAGAGAIGTCITHTAMTVSCKLVLLEEGPNKMSLTSVRVLVCVLMLLNAASPAWASPFFLSLFLRFLTTINNKTSLPPQQPPLLIM